MTRQTLTTLTCSFQRILQTIRVTFKTGARTQFHFSLLLCVGLAGCDQEPKSQQLLIENVNVIDPVRGLMPQQQILIEDGVITRVVDTAEGIEMRQDLQRFDGKGQYLLPGLWDMHVHFLYDPSLTNHMANLFLNYGVTSVRDTGGDIEELVALRANLPSPKPDIYFSGPLLDGAFVVYDGTDPARPQLGTSVPESGAAEATVAALQDNGADFIKIYELVSPDVYRALAAAAKSRNMPIASHVPLMMTADSAGPAANSMEHLRNIELACAKNWQQLLSERQRRITAFTEGLGYHLRAGLHRDQRLPAIDAYDEGRCNEVLDTLGGTIQVPTLRLNTNTHLKHFQREDWDTAVTNLPTDTQKSWRANIQIMGQMPPADPTFAQWSLFLVERLLARGVPIGAGTDTPIGLAIPGYSLHTELELLVDSGLTPQQALFSATVTPAQFFNLQDKMGRVAPGMQADLVLLKRNPLDDIRNSRTVAAVMKNGSWVR